MLDAKEKEEKKSDMNSLDPMRQLLGQEPDTEVVFLRKKIPVSDVKTADGPGHLQAAAYGPRKKVSVDVKFDFGVSLKSPTKEQHTPPQRPPPPKITPTHLSAIELHQQLLEIDGKLSELELKGRDLEDSIRSVTTAEDEDEMLMEWFKLVTKKNELVRKEADLVYQSREQTLEDEQVQIDSQLHYLLGKEDAEKSFEEKEEEEYLIQRKLEIVNQRNCIVDSIDEDRLRYEEEDRNVAQLMESKGFSKTTAGTVTNDKGKKVFTSTFYT
ncbi:MICAL-like protein 2 isoform X2 [Pomacea canaliculata]|uniref:MICAL-like protein 2 isoform X2 n=1 Tax=Pomacea canaliculata TaxID=400727 RepID=UPI000D72BE27|nr:MICAL-like protein 2 isoform X2 [Pomacea canaliculata]